MRWTDGEKPHLLWVGRGWACVGSGYVGMGDSLKGAYMMWVCTKSGVPMLLF